MFPLVIAGYEYASLGDLMLHHTVFHVDDTAYNLMRYSRRHFPEEPFVQERL